MKIITNYYATQSAKEKIFQEIFFSLNTWRRAATASFDNQ